MSDQEYTQGLSEELLVAHEALNHGCNVSLPFGGKSQYDLLVERGGDILKIQVKTASRERDFVQEIQELDKYEASDVDFFAGVVDFDNFQVDEALSVEGPRHIFYKSFEKDVNGQTARVNYRPPEELSDHNQDEANLAEEYDFMAKIEPEFSN